MLIKDCVRDNKQPLVSKPTIQLERNYGGLSVPNIDILKTCVHVKVLYNVMNSNDQIWKAIGKAYRKSPGKIRVMDKILQGIFKS